MDGARVGLLFNVVYAVLSWPAGKVCRPRTAALAGGGAATRLRGVYAGFAWSRTPQLVWFLFAAYGIYYALTEGVMKAWIADLAPVDSRAWAFGILNWVVGVAAFPASFVAGWIWQRYSPAVPFALSSLLSLAAGVLLLFA